MSELGLCAPFDTPSPSLQVIKNAKQSLTELILFCTVDSNTDPFTRGGVPIRRHQKVILDQGLHKIVLQMLKCPFFIPKDSSKSQPMVCITNIKKPEYHMLHVVCCLCFRFLRQTVIGSPPFALQLCNAIPFMMRQLGYRFHVADTLSTMFSENRMLIEYINTKMIIQWVDHAKLQKNQLRYAKFLGKVCVCDGENISRIQESVANLVIGGAPQLLVKVYLCCVALQIVAVVLCCISSLSPSLSLSLCVCVCLPECLFARPSVNRHRLCASRCQLCY